MKKHLLLLIFALAASALQAQNGELYSFMSHDMGGYGFGIESVAQQRDGDIITVTHISQYPVFLGNIFLKMSPTSLSITDTLFVNDTLPPYYFYAQDPHGEGNIRTHIEYVEEVDSSYVRICHFPDNDLNIDHNEDIMVPLRKGIAYEQDEACMIDCWGDIIMTYAIDRPDGGYDCHIARIDPAGTLKYQTLLFENEPYQIPKLRIFKESPLQYYKWSYAESNVGPGYNLAVYVIDSLFNKNTIIIDKTLREESLSDEFTWVAHEYLAFNNDTEVIPIGGDDILVAAQYIYDTNYYPMTAEYGVAVAKYDIRTMQLKDYIVFNDYPGYYHEGQCLGLKAMTDGTVYFLYKETGYTDDSFIAVKMDTDLNMEWKRFCKTEKIKLLAPLFSPILKKDGQGEEDGIAWVGCCKMMDSNKQNLLFFILNHEGPVGMNESGIEVRPYGFYPNPAKNQLHMEFSPDVQPARVELYDLQGRLVHTQRNTFESINLSQLPAGTYTMRVVLENGESYSDKVVKE